MKKLLKLATLASFTLFLAACQNKPAEPAAPESNVEAPAESTVESAETSQVEPEEDASKEEETSEDKEEKPEDEAIKEADADSPIPADHVRLTLYTSPSEKPTHVYDVEYVEDMNVLDLLDSVKDLEFNFNEEEGVVDEIDGTENDNELGDTWMYLLNGEFAELGVISQTLQEGDEVTWYFGTPDDLPMAHERNAAPAEEDAEAEEDDVTEEEEIVEDEEQ